MAGELCDGAPLVACYHGHDHLIRREDLGQQHGWG
jgi:hypothetical protein